MLFKIKCEKILKFCRAAVIHRLLQNNQLSGVVPTEIGKLSELQTLDLSSNQFHGEIPSSLGRLTRLSYL